MSLSTSAARRLVSAILLSAAGAVNGALNPLQQTTIKRGATWGGRRKCGRVHSQTGAGAGQMRSCGPCETGHADLVRELRIVFALQFDIAEEHAIAAQAAGRAKRGDGRSGVGNRSLHASCRPGAISSSQEVMAQPCCSFRSAKCRSWRRCRCRGFLREPGVNWWRLQA